MTVTPAQGETEAVERLWWRAPFGGTQIWAGDTKNNPTYVGTARRSADAEMIVAAVNERASLLARIAALEAGRSRAVEVLGPFAEWAGVLSPEFDDHGDEIILAGRDGVGVTFGNLRAAATLLKEWTNG